MLSERILYLPNPYEEGDLDEIVDAVAKLEAVARASTRVLADYRKRVRYGDWPEIIVNLAEALKEAEGLY